jgi:NAD+ kinase
MDVKALIVSRIDNAAALEFARTIRDLLFSSGCDVAYDHDTGIALNGFGEPLETVVADVVIVVGGDGTILRTIQQMQHPAPVLGINWGEVGFLADLEPEDAIGFVMTLPAGFAVEERMRISLRMEDRPLGVALNEALFVTTRPAKMLRFSIFVDGVMAEQFRADGLLVSTPTGSTAYAMSAGGPIVDPRVHGFLLVPLAPYMLSSRPHLISSNRRLEIRIDSAKPAHLVIDGQQTFDLGTSSTIAIVRYEKPALFVDVRRNFFEKVDRKLRKL